MHVDSLCFTARKSRVSAAACETRLWSPGHISDVGHSSVVRTNGRSWTAMYRYGRTTSLYTACTKQEKAALTVLKLSHAICKGQIASVHCPVSCSGDRGLLVSPFESVRDFICVYVCLGLSASLALSNCVSHCPPRLTRIGLLAQEVHTGTVCK